MYRVLAKEFHDGGIIVFKSQDMEFKTAVNIFREPYYYPKESDLTITTATVDDEIVFQAIREGIKIEQEYPDSKNAVYISDNKFDYNRYKLQIVESKYARFLVAII